MVLQTFFSLLIYWGMIALPCSLAYHLVGQEAGLITVVVVGAIALAASDWLETRLKFGFVRLTAMLSSLWPR